MDFASLNHIDAHTHLNFPHFNDDREGVIKEMAEKNIAVINVGTNLKTSKESVDLADQHRHIFASVGCHPTEGVTNFDSSKYKELLERNSESVVSVGECGFDYYRKQHRGDKEKKLQQSAFVTQIKLAIEFDLPLIFHIRPRQNSLDAYKDTLDILSHYKQKYNEIRGTAHFFVGDKKTAHQFLELGFYISAAGPVTFDQTLMEVFSDLPQDKLIVETDSPFAAPAAHRGQRNSPLFLPEIVASLAGVREEDEEDLAKQLVRNTKRLFLKTP